MARDSTPLVLSATTIAYESGPLPQSGQGTVVLRLFVAGMGDRTQLRIEREERRPHKTMQSVVLRTAHPRRGIEPLAHAMTTIACELERLHRQGYWLRERAGGGLRGAWHAELLSPSDSRAVASWRIDIRKPSKRLEVLAHALAGIGVSATQADRSAEDTEALAALMREHGADVLRDHALDALIATDPMAPTDEFLDDLEKRGLLTTADDESDGGQARSDSRG